MTIAAFSIRELTTIPDQLAGKVFVEGKHIVILDQYKNEIPLDKCATPEQLLECVLDLCDKGWVNPIIIHRVVTTACKENNLKINR